MKVYLVANQGDRTAFKITTAHVYSSLEKVIEHTLVDLVDLRRYNYTEGQIIEDLMVFSWDSNMYTADIDDLENKAKKFRDEKLWKSTVKEFINKYPDKIKDAEQKIKDAEQKRKEKYRK